ncbi:HEAT repeat domain-containing protein, partial [Streptomyces sp. NPDC002920]
RAAPPETLAPLYTDPGRAVRRYAYRLAVDEGFLSPAELARAAARDSDAVVRSLCADAALAAVSDDGGAYDDVLEPLLAARGPRARAAGVTALRRAGRPERAVGFLGDRSGLVRACARYVVRQYGGDPLTWYRERCAEPEGPAPGAVIGLAESGGREDAELLRPLLGHPSAGVRARAVAGLRILDVTDVRRLRPLLDDPAPGVVREVTAALLPSAERLDEAELTARLADRWPRHVRVAAFRLLDAQGGLARLRAAVGSLDDPDVRIRHWAQQSVQGWHAPADLPREAAAEVGELLDRARHLFSEYVLTRRKWEAGLRG